MNTNKRAALAILIGDYRKDHKTMFYEWLSRGHLNETFEQAKEKLDDWYRWRCEACGIDYEEEFRETMVRLRKLQEKGTAEPHFEPHLQ